MDGRNVQGMWEHFGSFWREAAGLRSRRTRALCGTCSQGLCRCEPRLASRRVAGKVCKLRSMHITGACCGLDMGVARCRALAGAVLIPGVDLRGYHEEIREFVHSLLQWGTAGVGLALGCGTGAVVVAAVTLLGAGFFRGACSNAAANGLLCAVRQGWILMCFCGALSRGSIAALPALRFVAMVLRLWSGRGVIERTHPETGRMGPARKGGAAILP